MLDLGRSFLAAAERSPRALAIVDGERRLTYGEWLSEIGRVAAGLRALNLAPGDRVLSLLQNTLEAATLHWACQFAAFALVPLNWRAKPEEAEYCLRDSGAAALVFEASSADAASCQDASSLPRIAVGDTPGGTHVFAALSAGTAVTPEPLARGETVSLMLYTSGTTGRPKGVPRRHFAERAAAVAHVAQNLYPRGERTLGVMPLYHTMGVRSLLSMALVDGLFACLPRYDGAAALRLIGAERLTSLYLVPTLYHDLLHQPGFAAGDTSSLRRLGFAGAAMPDGLLAQVVQAFRPERLVNHYGSSEVYTFTIDQDAPRKPGSAGRAGLNQRIRVVRLGGDGPDAILPAGEEGEIIADLAGDEAFEGYWNRPDADARSLRGGWYFTGDTGHFDAEGDLFVTGRVDDMIITGGENVSPGEVENVLSLHAAVSEVAVAGLPDERWGRRVTAFVRAAAPVGAAELDAWCRRSALANFKRPREYVFVREIPKSPVGKILRRLLAAGAYETDETLLNRQDHSA